MKKIVEYERVLRKSILAADHVQNFPFTGRLEENATVKPYSTVTDLRLLLLISPSAGVFIKLRKSLQPQGQATELSPH